MPVVSLESAPEPAGLVPSSVEIKISDELRADILAEIDKRVSPEKINLAVKLVRDCPKCQLPLRSDTTMLFEFHRADGDKQRSETALAMCVRCGDAFAASSLEPSKKLGLECVTIDGRLMNWN